MNTGSTRVAADFPDDLPAERKAELLGALLEALNGPLRWLRDELGYELEEAGFPRLRLRTHDSLLDLSFGVIHGPRLALFAHLHEVGDEQYFDPGWILYLTGDSPTRIDTEVTGPQDVAAAAGRLSERLEEVRTWLAGGPEGFVRLRALAAEATEEAELERELEVQLPRADQAFREQDWPRVEALLGPLEGRLPRSAQKKLDHARRQLG